jgi:hypothetical protein
MTSPIGSNKTGKGITKAFDNTVPPESLDAKLKEADPEIQQYIVALKSENLKFLRKVANCEAEKVTLQNQIIILEQDLANAKQQAGIATTSELIETIRAQKDKK